jgi:hypothetical protein
MGTIVPWVAFLPFLHEHGPDPGAFVRQLFGTPISGFFGWDVICSSLVLWAFVAIEGRRLTVRGLWMPIAGTLVVGVSLGLPLFLYLRELRREAKP